jgi:hypothetical protein
VEPVADQEGIISLLKAPFSEKRMLQYRL